jgi:hypothetical protein
LNWTILNTYMRMYEVTNLYLYNSDIKMEDI